MQFVALLSRRLQQQQQTDKASSVLRLGKAEGGLGGVLRTVVVQGHEQLGAQLAQRSLDTLMSVTQHTSHAGWSTNAHANMYLGKAEGGLGGVLRVVVVQSHEQLGPQRAQRSLRHAHGRAVRATQAVCHEPAAAAVDARALAHHGHQPLQSHTALEHCW